MSIESYDPVILMGEQRTLKDFWPEWDMEHLEFALRTFIRKARASGRTKEDALNELTQIWKLDEETAEEAVGVLWDSYPPGGEACLERVGSLTQKLDSLQWERSILYKVIGNLAAREKHMPQRGFFPGYRILSSCRKYHSMLEEQRVWSFWITEIETPFPRELPFDLVEREVETSCIVKSDSFLDSLGLRFLMAKCVYYGSLTDRLTYVEEHGGGNLIIALPSFYVDAKSRYWRFRIIHTEPVKELPEEFVTATVQRRRPKQYKKRDGKEID